MNVNTACKLIVLAIVIAAFWLLLSWHFALVPLAFAAALKAPSRLSLGGAIGAFALFCALLAFGSYAERTKLSSTMSPVHLDLVINAFFASFTAAMGLFTGWYVRKNFLRLD